MRILQLAGYFFPEKAASIYLEDNRYEAFSKAGFTTIVYAARPQRGLSKEEYQRYKHINYELMYDNSVEVHRFAMFRERKSVIWRSFRYFFISIIQFWDGVFTRGIDLVYVASTPPTQGALAALVKRIKHIPFVYNLQDIFPDSLVGAGITLQESLLWKIGRVIEDFTYRNADKIIVISEGFKKNLMAKGVPEDKIVVIYNWVDEEVVVNVPRVENKVFQKYGLDHSKFYIVYSGNLGLSQNMDMLLDVMSELKTEVPDVQLVLIGDGAYKEEIVKKIAGQIGKNGAIKGTVVPNVIMLPFQPYEDISHVFSLGDVGLVISKPGVGVNSVPSKTWSIMSASRPVLASFDENELKGIITDNYCGLYTKAGDKESFKASILKMYHNPELCEYYGQNGRQFVLDNLTKAVGTQKYVDVIKQFEQ